MEIDMPCRRDGDRLIVGEGDEWMEIGGSGMVNGRVLAHAGIDPANIRVLPLAWGLTGWPC